jgi:hypothetical protein
MSFVGLFSVSEDKIFRYGSLVVPAFYPWITIILLTDRQIFFDLDIFRILLLAMFYSVPVLFMSMLTSWVYVLWFAKRYKAKELIGMISSSSILMSLVMTIVVTGEAYFDKPRPDASALYIYFVLFVV